MKLEEYKKRLRVYEYEMILLCTEDEVRAFFEYMGNCPPVCVHVTQHGFKEAENEA